MDYLIRKAKTVRKMKALFTGASKRTMRRSLTESRKEESFEGMGKPSVSHATVVIFLEFFAWGLMTTPTINALKDAFPTGTFLKNGFVQGIKGLLSFLSAPLIGALSDVWGRKSFLLLCVFFTCLPIPLLLFDSKFYFISMSLSGIFCVTFSIVFAYVADCTTEKERSYSYGLVSATFAASLVLSPALGTWICGFPNGQTQVVIISSLVTLFNLLFIMYIVPESLPESSRKTLWGSPISWRQADPFSSLRKAGNDTRLLLLSIMVFLSYLPEAGQYSCFFLYLRQVIGFSLSEVSLFISVLCITSVIAQTLILSFLMNLFGYRYTIVFGLIVQSIQLFIYGVWTSKWLMWLAGTFASLSTIIYPAISALVSKNTDSEQQGVALGILTGMRGLCNGLGPALFGLFFYLSDVHLEEVQVGGMSVPAANPHLLKTLTSFSSSNSTINQIMMGGMFKGLPFLFGVLPVLLALVVALCIDDNMPLLKKPHPSSPSGHTFSSHQNSISDI